MIAAFRAGVVRRSMSDGIVIRELSSMDELLRTVELQKAVWGMEDFELSSPHTLRAIAHAGGCVIAAADGERLVGFCFGMAAWRWGELWVWSHMTGVRPQYQGRGIGLRLKLAQREWALARGFRQMAWTFDPLQSGNANFNFNQLGVSARMYSVNHYGDMQDGINAGLASDRLEAQWQLDAPNVVDMARGRRPEPDSAGDEQRLVWVDDAGALRSAAPDYDQARYTVEIPRDIAALKQRNLARAQAWQLAVRGALTALFDAGYVVSGFRRSGGKAWYVVRRG